MLLTEPVITIANRAMTLSGAVLYRCVFVVRGLLIVLAGWFVERPAHHEPDCIDP